MVIGVEEKVSYNGWRIVDENDGALHGELGARAVSAAEMALSGVQGRVVMVDLRHHYGDARTRSPMKCWKR